MSYNNYFSILFQDTNILVRLKELNSGFYDTIISCGEDGPLPSEVIRMTQIIVDDLVKQCGK